MSRADDTPQLTATMSGPPSNPPWGRLWALYLSHPAVRAGYWWVAGRGWIADKLPDGTPVRRIYTDLQRATMVRVVERGVSHLPAGAVWVLVHENTPALTGADPMDITKESVA